MYQVMINVPVYGSRDELVGSRYYPADKLPVYETLAYAQYRAACLDAELCGDVFIIVMQWQDGCLRKIPAPRIIDNGDNDIPF